MQHAGVLTLDKASFCKGWISRVGIARVGIALPVSHVALVYARLRESAGCAQLAWVMAHHQWAAAIHARREWGSPVHAVGRHHLDQFAVD